MSSTKLKYYDIDGPMGGSQADSVSEHKSKAIFAAAARRRDSGHNERFGLMISFVSLFKEGTGNGLATCCAYVCVCVNSHFHTVNVSLLLCSAVAVSL